MLTPSHSLRSPPVNGITVNNIRKRNSPWIFRASFKPADISAHGRILVVSVPIYDFDWTVYARTDRSQNMRVDYISLTTEKNISKDPINQFESVSRSIVKMKWHNRDNSLIDERTLDVWPPWPYAYPGEAGAGSGEWEKGDVTLLHFLMAGVRGPSRNVSWNAQDQAMDFDHVAEHCQAKEEGRGEVIYATVRFFSDEDVAELREWKE